MSGLTLKRVLVIGISQLLGFLLTYLIITVGFNLLPFFSSIEAPQGISIAEYGWLYFLVTAVPIGITVMIWLDKFMDTGILPD
jgi:hypothetical protein